jgi:hypothetical protein
MVVITIAVVWLLQQWQSSRCPAGTFLVGPAQGGMVVQVAPILFASIGFGLIFMFWFAHTIPPLRGSFGRAADGDHESVYRRSQHALVRLSLPVALIALPISVVGSLPQYCLLESGFLYQSWPWNAPRSYSWSDVAEVATACHYRKNGWYPSFVVITRDGESFDLMDWLPSFMRAYPEIARALHGVEFKFNSTHVNRDCVDFDGGLLLRRP